MKYKFFICKVFWSEGITMLPVYNKLTGERLEFDTYDRAEAWILGQRQDGVMELYQIQKVYVP